MCILSQMKKRWDDKDDDDDDDGDNNNSIPYTELIYSSIYLFCGLDYYYGYAKVNSIRSQQQRNRHKTLIDGTGF